MSGTNNTKNNTSNEEDFTNQVRRVSERLRGGSAPPPETANQAKESKKKTKKNMSETQRVQLGARIQDANRASNPGARTGNPGGINKQVDPGVLETRLTPTTIRIPACSLARSTGPDPLRVPQNTAVANNGGAQGRIPIIAVHTPSSGIPTKQQSSVIDPSLLEAPRPSGLIQRDIVSGIPKRKRQ